MRITSDGRWVMSLKDIENKVWEKVKGWKRDPSDERYLIPAFPPCVRRSLETICLPCGKNSNFAYNCSKFKTRVSVLYCQACEKRGENELLQSSPPAGAADDYCI